MAGIRMRSRSEYPTDIRDDKNIPDKFDVETKKAATKMWLSLVSQLPPAEAVAVLGTALRIGHDDNGELVATLLRKLK